MDATAAKYTACFTEVASEIAADIVEEDELPKAYQTVGTLYNVLQSPSHSEFRDTFRDCVASDGATEEEKAGISTQLSEPQQQFVFPYIRRATGFQ